MNYLTYTLNSIPIGQKGWKAETMQTWSKDEMKKVLEQYGKEGLRPATYAYLMRRIHPEKYAQTAKSTNTITNADVRLLQQSMGFTGKSLDGIYGAATIQAMKQKYGTTNIYEALKQIKAQQAPQPQASDNQPSIPYLFDKTKYNLEQDDSVPQLGSTATNSLSSVKQNQQKGVDYRGQNSWTETRVQANKDNSINTEYQPPKEEKKEFSVDDMYFVDYQAKPLTTETGMPDYAAIRQQYDNEYDQKYGKGNWHRDANGKIVTRQIAPNIEQSSFNVPQEWEDFIHTNQSRVGSAHESLSDNAVASYLFGDDSGFHTGTWLFGSMGRVPMYLSNEKSLEDAYAKAYAAGNRRFTYDGKTYTTTSYTKPAQDYLQALYDAEFEKSRDGKISDETQKIITNAKAAWANDELHRYGIDARTLGSESHSGYPVATNYNISNNIGQFGYNNGVGRMIMTADGYLDLGQNNSTINQDNDSWWDKMGNMVSYPNVDRNTKHSTPQRTALLKLGVSQALEPDSPELKKITINPEIQPAYMSGQPTNYAYTVDQVTAFKPDSDSKWEKKTSGNYTRTGTQVGGTMWNATEVYDPRRNLTYTYDVNDYGLGPNSMFG